MSQHKAILIVEDDLSIRDTLQILLEGEGYDVRAAEDGQEALDLLSQSEFRPSLILLDLYMPRLSGREFLIKRRERKLALDARVLIFAASGENEALADVDLWIGKPVEIDFLMESVQKFSA